jgi:hypothetical protein
MAATPKPSPKPLPLELAVFSDAEGRPCLRLPVHLPPGLALAVYDFLLDLEGAWFDAHEAQPGFRDLLCAQAIAKLELAEFEGEVERMLEDGGDDIPF